MKLNMKTIAASVAILAVTGLAQADPTVQVTEMDAQTTNLKPGYSDTIDMATINSLDTVVKQLPEFEQPSNFMSDEGVYRYAYFEKTGKWLTLNEARAALEMETAAENIETE